MALPAARSEADQRFEEAQDLVPGHPAMPAEPHQQRQDCRGINLLSQHDRRLTPTNHRSSPTGESMPVTVTFVGICTFVLNEDGGFKEVLLPDAEFSGPPESGVRNRHFDRSLA